MSLRGAYPPSFCRWRALLGVMAVSLLASVLILLGNAEPASLGTSSLLLAYGQVLGLFCALGLCTLCLLYTSDAADE